MANKRFIDFPIASTVGDNDIILIWQGGANKQTTKATILSGVPDSLNDLTDVTISGLTNGQILRYDSVTGQWENTDQGNLDLNDLNDVTIVSPTNGQVLVYNSSTSKWENSSGGYVPYVGAVTTVDLGLQGLEAGYVRFDTSIVSVPDEQGLMYWDASRSTVALIMNGTLQHIGQDTFFYVKNSTGSSIPKGTAVGFAGTDGASGHLLITPFLANGSVPSTYFMGVTAEVIANGDFGQVMHFGELDGINTSGFTAGALLYASSTVAGAFQTTAPVAPNNIILVAAAVNSKNNGSIVVRPTYGSNINTDEGVKITSPTTGDLLQLQVGGLWENKTIDAAGIVTKATNQTITGIKTFSQDIIVNGVNVGRGGGTITSNTIVGEYALNANTTGNSNTAIGQASMVFNTTGASNTAVGRGALEKNTTAIWNCGIGTFSLFGNTTGSSNIAVGNGAGGFIADGITENSITNNSVFLGGNTKALANNQTNQIVIGHNAIGGGSNTVVIGNSSILSNRFFGTMRIGTINNGVGDFITTDANGVLTKRTGAEVRTDIGAGTVTSVAALTLGTSGTDLSSTVANGTTTPVITLNVPTASATNRGALSSTDWTTFNNKQNALTNPVTGTGTTNYLAKFTGATTVGNSQIFDNGTNVGINQASPTRTVDILGASGIGTVLKLQGASGTTTYLQLAYNGATNAQSGYIGYNSSSQMQFFTNDTLALTIDSNRNLGLGVTPSAWNSSVRVIEIANTGNFIGNSGYDNWLATNTIYDSGATFRYARTGSAVAFYSQSSGGHFWFNAPIGTAGNAISFTQAMTLYSTGNLVIGTNTDNGARLQVEHNGNSPLLISTSSTTLFTTYRSNSVVVGYIGNGDGIVSSGGATNFGIRAENDLIFTSGGNNRRMTITSGGNVLIGTTTDGGQRLQVSGTSKFNNNMDIGTSSTNNILMYCAGSNNPSVGVYGGAGSNSANGAASLNVVDFTNNKYWQIQIDGSSQLATFYYNGSVWSKVGYQTTGGTWTNSDKRRKENIEISKYGLNEVLQLKPKKFNYKLDERKIKNLGFIAQDVIDLIPESVQTDIDGQEEYYAMNYSNLVPVLVKAIQELKQEIDTLKK